MNTFSRTQPSRARRPAWPLAGLMTGLLAAALLSACGGGSSGSNEPDTITGKVIDGYIKGATVFWDCNGNNRPDDTETSVQTASGGVYLIPKTLNPSCKLMALVGVGAVDEDDPGRVNTSEYVMYAAPDTPNLITPYSTLIAAKLWSGQAKTVSESKDKVATELNLPAAQHGDLLVDYKAQATPDPAKTATSKYVVNELQKLPVDQNYSPNITQILQPKIAASVQNPTIAAALNLGATTVLYDPQSASTAWQKAGQPSSNAAEIKGSRIILTFSAANPDEQAFYDQVIAKLNAAHAGAKGFVDFSALSAAEIHTIFYGFHSRKIGETDPRLQAAIAKFKTTRDARIAELTNAQEIQDITKNQSDFARYLTFWTSDGEATFDYALSVGGAILEMQGDGISLLTAGYFGKMSSVAQTALKSKRSAERLAELLDKIGTGASGVDCTKKIAKAITDSTTTSADWVPACQDLMVGLLADAKTMRKYKSFSAASKAGAKFTVTTYDHLQGLQSEASTRQWIKLVVDVFDIVKEVAAFSPDPATGTVMSGLDMPVQLLKIWIAASETSDTLIGAKEKIAALYAEQMAQASINYEASYLSFFASYFQLVDESTAVVTSFKPATAAAGKATTFSVTGQNLPATAVLAIEDATCTAPVNTLTGFDQTCTIAGAAGDKKVSIKSNTDTNGGALIDGTKKVLLDALKCPEPQVPNADGTACVLKQAPFHADFNTANSLVGWKLSSPYALESGSLVLTGGGGAGSPTFSVGNRIKISIRHLMHWGRHYIFLSHDELTGDLLKGISISFPVSDYDRPFISLKTGKYIEFTRNHIVVSSTLYERFITTIVNYDSTTGEISVDYDGDGVFDVKAIIDPSEIFTPSRLTIATGDGKHQPHAIDDVLVEAY